MTDKSQQLSEQDKELISSIYEDFNKCVIAIDIECELNNLK